MSFRKAGERGGEITSFRRRRFISVTFSLMPIQARRRGRRGGGDVSANERGGGGEGREEEGSVDTALLPLYEAVMATSVGGRLKRKEGREGGGLSFTAVIMSGDDAFPQPFPPLNPLPPPFSTQKKSPKRGERRRERRRESVIPPPPSPSTLPPCWH